MVKAPLSDKKRREILHGLEKIEGRLSRESSPLTQTLLRLTDSLSAHIPDEEIQVELAMSAALLARRLLWITPDRAQMREAVWDFLAEATQTLSLEPHQPLSEEAAEAFVKLSETRPKAQPRKRTTSNGRPKK